MQSGRGTVLSKTVYAVSVASFFVLTVDGCLNACRIIAIGTQQNDVCCCLDQMDLLIERGGNLFLATMC